MNINRITFVWNADFSVAGGLRALGEVVEGKHSCTLCELAYHRVSQTKEWKSYRKALAKMHDAEVRQPCRNQLSQAEREAANGRYPIVLAHTSAGIVALLDDKAIDSCEGDFEFFKNKLDKAIEALLEQ